jgi:cell division protein FtsB
MMLETLLPFILLGLSLVSGILGWLAAKLWGMVEKLTEKIQQLEVTLTAEYVRYDRLQDALKPMMETLTEIKEALKGKADK